jgi:hypothetical protein
MVLVLPYTRGSFLLLMFLLFNHNNTPHPRHGDAQGYLDASQSPALRNRVGRAGTSLWQRKVAFSVITSAPNARRPKWNHAVQRKSTERNRDFSWITPERAD